MYLDHANGDNYILLWWMQEVVKYKGTRDCSHFCMQSANSFFFFFFFTFRQNLPVPKRYFKIQESHTALALLNPQLHLFLVINHQRLQRKTNLKHQEFGKQTTKRIQKTQHIFLIGCLLQEFLASIMIWQNFDCFYNVWFGEMSLPFSFYNFVKSINAIKKEI